MEVKKKKTKIVILVITLIVLLAGSVLGVLWWQTNVFDFLKNPRQLFWTYMGQNLEGLPEFDFDDWTRLSEESRRSNSRISWNVDVAGIGGMEAEILDVLNNVSLTTEETFDAGNQRRGFDISAYYRNDMLANLDVVLERDAIHVGAPQIIEQFLTLENRNLSDLAMMFGIPGMPDSIDMDMLFENNNISEDEWDEIARRYLRIVYNGISRENFTQSREEIQINRETVRANAFTLTLTPQEIIEVGILLFEELRDDQLFLDFLVENMPDMTRRDLQNQITGFIADMNREIDYLNRSGDEGRLIITVYEYRGTTVRTDFIVESTNFRGEPTTEGLRIERQVNGNEIELTFISLDGRREEVLFTVETVSDDGDYLVRLNFEINGIDIALQISGREDLTATDMRLNLEMPGVRFVLNIESTTRFEDVQISRIRENIILNDLELEQFALLLGMLQEGAFEFLTENEDIFGELLEILRTN